MVFGIKLLMSARGKLIHRNQNAACDTGLLRFPRFANVNKLDRMGILGRFFEFGFGLLHGYFVSKHSLKNNARGAPGAMSEKDNGFYAGTVDCLERSFEHPEGTRT